MRNLRIVRKFTSASPLPLPSSSIFCAGENGCLFGCVRIENELVADDASLNSSEAETNLPPPHQFLSNLIRISEFNHIEELTNSNLLQDTFAMQYVPSTECLFLANTNGTLLQYQLNGEVEEVLTIEVGIRSFNISPDSRLALIITRTGSLILTRLLELESVAQFQMVKEADAEEAKITTSWRQDCKYFVVNVPDEKTRRRLKIFDENGSQVSTTEDSTLLISPIIDWQPKGSLMVSLEKSPPGRNTDAIVSFFELNGLKRSEFDCSEGRSTLNQDKILSLVWNNTSDLLAMRKRHCIELWYRSNYVWMCKSSIFSRRKGDDGKGALDGIKFFTWDKQFAYKLHVVFESGFYSAYDFAFGYSCGETNGSRITASLNGSVVYFTPFRDNYAPPPYGFSQVSLPSLVKEVVLSKFYDGFLCVLSSGNIALVQNQGPIAPACKMFNCEPEHKIIRSYGWIWPNSSTLCGIKDNSLLIWKLPNDAMCLESKLDTLITLKSSHPLNCTSVWPVYWKNRADATHLVIQKACGYLLLMDLENSETKKLLRIPSNAFHTLKFMCDDETGDGDIVSNLIIIGHDHLTRKLEVFMSPKYSYKISSDCTSFEVYEDYLLFTTIQGSLEIVHVSSLSPLFQGATIDQSANLEKYSRKIEKGSLIVSCGLNLMLEPSLILQILPRGNLETISPRPLILSSLNALLRDEGKRSFEAIMSAMRRHRINSNILVEELKLVEAERIHNVSLRQLLQSIVGQVNDSNLLVLFVTELTQENVSCIELIRDILEEYINASGDKDDKGILPYLAAMAKLGRYEQVLHSKLVLGEADRELVKSRIKFLSFYSENSEILYEAALGTYDLSLASVVCDCLNKDPKEYLPILNELQDLPLKRRLFSIDNTLKRYSKAVTHLISDSTAKHEEIVKYIEKHKVFTEGLQILEDTISSTANSSRNSEDVETLTRMVHASFGHYLEIQGKMKEASILYARGENFVKAIDCCLKTGCWESALGIAFEQRMPDEDLQKLYKDIVDTLENQKDFETAAHICQVYLKDTSTALEFYIRAKKWLLARSLILERKESNGLLETSLCPKLAESCKLLEEVLNSKETELQKYMNRLRAIRALKAAKEAGEMDGENENFSDTESVATTSTRSSSFSSTGSTGTGKTYRSSKNRRKAERKLYSLKEGSKYEDVAITIYLWDLANHVQNEMKTEYAYTVESLWRFQLNENAKNLTRLFDAFLQTVNAAVVEVWSGGVLSETPLLEPKYRISPIGFNTIWDKLSFSISPSKAI